MLAVGNEAYCQPANSSVCYSGYWDVYQITSVWHIPLCCTPDYSWKGYVFLKIYFLLWFLPHMGQTNKNNKKETGCSLWEEFIVHHSPSAPQLKSCICQAFHRKINSAHHQCTVTMSMPSSKLSAMFCNFPSQQKSGSSQQKHLEVNACMWERGELFAATLFTGEMAQRKLSVLWRGFFSSTAVES